MIRKTKNKQTGVVAIEFSIGFGAFLLMMAAWMEISYMGYISAMGDLAISEAARTSKKETTNYIDTFKATLTASDSVWSKFVDTSKIRASVQYAKSLDDLYGIENTCLPASSGSVTTCGTESDSAIAIYYVDYEFDSIFTVFFDTKTIFSREIIVIQEYERDKFQI
ncbi:TadE/TadG family type IV pilus assembly protein [Vibrio algarum]|uniref:Pilus assembly protein n=1 Tax=Vibrio algarum TaxID=3020714 RepID=A0ABT4YNM1_9VIBR|nr:TadE family protein [Vibrio sp. KJ40-1]MDB1123136.1 pilus assembly protein [Vibrio sp. KJ40-1]